MSINTFGPSMKRVSKLITFTGAANLGAVGTVPIFTTTGEVLVVAISPYCTVDLVGATATITLGVVNNTSLFVASSTATDIDAGDFWFDNTPTEVGGVAMPSALKDIAITDNIIGTVGTAAITAGAMRFDVWYLPLSSDGGLV